MHVSPAKHSYVWLPRKCDYRTDRHTHGQTDRRRTKWSLCAAMLRRRHKNAVCRTWEMHLTWWKIWIHLAPELFSCSLFYLQRLVVAEDQRSLNNFVLREDRSRGKLISKGPTKSMETRMRKAMLHIFIYVSPKECAVIPFHLCKGILYTFNDFRRLCTPGSTEIRVAK